MICGICVTRRELDMDLGDTWGACLRPEAHLGAHLFQNVLGTYFVWEDDDECDCCEPEDYDRCLSYHSVTPEQAQLFLTSTKPLEHEP